MLELGALRRNMAKKAKLAVASETKIEVHAEAVLEFEENWDQCWMRSRDSDVKKLLAAVSATNDDGNKVVFSKKWEKLHRDLRDRREDDDRTSAARSR